MNKDYVIVCHEERMKTVSRRECWAKQEPPGWQSVVTCLLHMRLLLLDYLDGKLQPNKCDELYHTLLFC